MYYYGARYYDPKVSVFLNVDPLAEQTMEPYAYVGNNPVMFVDPTGMSKEGDGWFSKVWDEVKSWFSNKTKVTVGPLQEVPLETQNAFVGAPTLVNSLTKTKTAVETATVVETAIGISGSALATGSLLLLASGDERKDDDGEGYLYRNMKSDGVFLPAPLLGQSANTLGIRAADVNHRDFNEIISSISTDGLSTTFGMGNYRKDFSVIPSSIPNYSYGKTTLFRIKITELPQFKLKATPIEGTYYRITPATDMSIQEFHNRIQNTQKLWKIAPSHRK